MIFNYLIVFIYNMPPSLDEFDRRILYEFDRGARRSYAEIGRRAKLSKQTVRNKVKKLVDEGVIQKFLTVMDVSKLGYTAYKVLMRLQNTDRRREQTIINYLANHPNVQFFASCDGNFDLAFNVLAGNENELDSVLHGMQEKFGEFIAERQLAIMLKANFYHRDYLLEKKKQANKEMSFGIEEGEAKLDNANKEILSLLGADARIPTMQIAGKIGLSADAVALRIKALERSGIIQNYVIVLNDEALNQLHYKVLFRLHNPDSSSEKRFEKYFQLQPNCWFANKALGYFDYEANFEMKNAAQFREIISDVKENFSEIMRDYIVLSMYKINKFNFYPMGQTL